MWFAQHSLGRPQSDGGDDRDYDDGSTYRRSHNVPVPVLIHAN
jgi:hypothetical protein